MAAAEKKTRMGPAAESALGGRARRGDPRVAACLDITALITALITAEGVVGYVSPAVTVALGRSADALVGRPMERLVYPGDRAVLRRMLAEVGETPGGGLTVECRLRGPRGTWRRFSVSAANLLDVPGVGSIVATLRALPGPVDVPEPHSWPDGVEGPDHFVQFYETDEFLAESVAGYVAEGLRAGEACVVLATAAHREAIEARLEAMGVDARAARAEGAYVALDAAEVLAAIMAGELPDVERFTGVIGGVLARAAEGGRRVRAFGELVALLAAAGNVVAAVRLEELWEALRDARGGFALFCAYPTETFAGETLAAGLADVCEQHARVIPDESYTGLADRDARLRAVALLQQKARSLEGEIAQRKGAQERLRATENRYRRLFEASRDGILMVDPDTQLIADANPAVTELLGRPREHLVGRELWQVGLFADREATLEALLDVRRRGTTRYETLPLRARDGARRYVELVGNQFRANGHDVIQCTLRDVTERREGERRTQDALTALLAIASTVMAPEPAAVGGAAVAPPDEARTGRRMARRLAELTCRVLGCRRVSITAVEPGTERLRAVAVVGLTPEQELGWWAEQRALEERGARLGDGADPDDVARFRAGEIAVLDVTAPRYRDLPNPYGAVTILAAPMRVGDQLVGIVALDYGGNTPHTFTLEEMALAGAVAQLGALVLERERLLAARAAAEAQALAFEAANLRMNEFLSIASHELRTPLTTIKANLQILARAYRRRTADDEPRPPSREALLLERSDRQVERLARLVEDMIDLARIRQDRLELRPEACDLAAVVREEVDVQRQAHPERKIRLALPAGDAAIPVVADPDRIGQVLTNFLTNALKYSEAERPVEVRVAVEGAGARVAVRDEGPGIPADERERVWEMFHRVPGVEVQSGSGVGLGLGLHITRTIVERHGGAVGVESAVGEGSTFWFTLPIAQG